MPFARVLVFIADEEVTTRGTEFSAGPSSGGPVHLRL
jgi:hypothetical protein